MSLKNKVIVLKIKKIKSSRKLFYVPAVEKWSGLSLSKMGHLLVSLDFLWAAGSLACEGRTGWACELSIHVYMKVDMHC